MVEAATRLPVTIERFSSRSTDECADARIDVPPASQGSRKDLPQTIISGGVPVPVERDRLQIVMETAEAPAFPLNQMPALFREMVEAAYEHVQAPLNLCAQAVLSGITLAAQGLADIRVPILVEPLPLSLFFFAVAASGERKTALDRIVQRPFVDREAMLAKSYEENLRQYQNERMLWEAERKRVVADKKLPKDQKRLVLEASPEPREPTPPFLRIKEPTLEGIVNLLRKGVLSVGVFTSEGGQFLGGHGMTDDTRMRTMTGLSELWDGGTAQRIRAAEITRISGRRVSVSLSVQPKIAATFLGNEAARDQGFLARFLVMMPDSTIGTREIREAKPMEDTRIIRFHQRLRDMLECGFQTRESSSGTELAPLVLTMREAPWRLWQAFAYEVEQASGKGGAFHPIQASALKMAENVARIAAVLTLFADEKAIEVDDANMVSAVEIGRFYLAETLRLLGHEVADPETLALNELAQWLAETWKHDRISATLIQQRAPQSLRGNAKKTRSRIIALCGCGVLILEGKGQVDGQSYREVYRINRSGA